MPRPAAAGSSSGLVLLSRAYSEDKLYTQVGGGTLGPVCTVHCSLLILTMCMWLLLCGQLKLCSRVHAVNVLLWCVAEQQ
jgi:hypothetical protein